MEDLLQEVKMLDCTIKKLKLKLFEEYTYIIQSHQNPMDYDVYLESIQNKIDILVDRRDEIMNNINFL